MARKQDRPRLDDTVEPSAVEISVAASGFLKPYLTCFRYSPENIDKEPLGALVGVLSIRDRSEDSAYIVNFLASLAKKEYYANARRTAVESFESMLHKVNIGLSELVKEGNANWVGTLDAAICVFERNSLHFAVAGDAKVILIRDGRLVDVSDGLTEGQDPHPLKTFTEVSSGKVREHDRLLITTPEIFSILTSGELERASNRLDDSAFDQFIRTAAINRLDCSGTLVMHIRKTKVEEKEPKKRPPLASPEYVPNAWSLSAFSNSKKPASEKNLATTREETPSRERVDDKTGHIYVTGEIQETPPNEQWESFRLRLDDIRLWIGRTEKHAFTYLSGMITAGARSTGQMLSQGAKHAAQAIAEWRKARTERLAQEKERRLAEELAQPAKNIASEKQSEDQTEIERYKKKRENEQEFHTSLPQSNVKEISLIQKAPLQTSAPIETASSEAFPKREASTPSDRLHAQLSHFYNKQTFRPEEKIATTTSFDDTTTPPALGVSKISNMLTPLRPFFSHLFGTLKHCFQKGITYWRSAPRRTRIILSALFVIAIISVAIALWKSGNANAPISETSEEALPPSSANSTQDDPSSKTFASIRTVDHSEIIVQGDAEMKTILLLGDMPYAVSTHEVISLGSPSQETIPIPDGKTAKYGTAMSDIQTLFILTDDGSLLGYTPANKKFSENAIDLPDTNNISGIDAFLTYLYVLDTAGGTIYRYPRAEGGFGEKTDWMKEKGAVPFGASFAVGESIAITAGSDLSLFERGTKLLTSFEHPSDILLFTSIFIGKNDTLFALDRENGRLIEYAPDSSIAHQYAGNLFRGATDFAVDTTTQTVFATNGSSILSATLE